LIVLAAACGDNRVPEDPAPNPMPDGGVEEMIEREHAGGAPSAVALADGTIFLGIGPRLEIRSSTARLGESAALRGNINALAVAGDRAFVAERTDLDALLHVFDVSNPASIVETKVVNLAQPDGGSVIRGLEVAGDTLYVSDQEQGVIELDITDPDAPVVVTTAPVFGVAGTTLSGHRLYYSASGFLGGVSVGALDVTDNLADLGTANLGDGAGLAVTGDLAISAGPNGIFVHSIADLANPVEKFHLGMPDMGPFSRAVAARGTTAWVPANEGLFTLDLADPDNITISAPVETPTVGANAVAADDTHVVAITDRGRMVRTAIAGGTPEVTDITLCADCVDLAIEGSTAFVADIVGGIRTAKVTNLDALGRSPSPDVEVGPNGLALVFEGVAVGGTRAYAGDWLYGLRVYDTTDPANLVELGSLVTGGAPSDVTVVGDRAYIPEGTNGGALHVIDVVDPAEPKLLGSIPTAKAMEVEVRDNIAYVADESLFEAGGFKIYDVADPANITQLGLYTTDCEFAGDVALLGNVAVVACGFNGFHIVDITDPRNPARLAVVPQPDITTALSVATYEGHAVLGHDRGVLVVDLTNPAAPQQVASKATAFGVRSIAIKQPGWIVAAAGQGGVYQWKID
jgi:hypothetical protein